MKCAILKTCIHIKHLKHRIVFTTQNIGVLINVFFPSSQDNKADVILKYNADEARSLKAYGELPEHGVYLRYCRPLHLTGSLVVQLLLTALCFTAKINETDTFGGGDDDEIQFDDIGDDDEDIDDVSADQDLNTFQRNLREITHFITKVKVYGRSHCKAMSCLLPRSNLELLRRGKWTFRSLQRQMSPVESALSPYV